MSHIEKLCDILLNQNLAVCNSIAMVGSTKKVVQVLQGIGARNQKIEKVTWRFAR